MSGMVALKNGESSSPFAMRDSATMDIPLVRKSLRFIDQTLHQVNVVQWRAWSRLLAHYPHHGIIGSIPPRRSIMFQLLRCIIPGKVGARASSLFVTVRVSIVLEER